MKPNQERVVLDADSGEGVEREYIAAVIRTQWTGGDQEDLLAFISEQQGRDNGMLLYPAWLMRRMTEYFETADGRREEATPELIRSLSRGDYLKVLEAVNQYNPLARQKGLLGATISSSSPNSETPS